MNILMEVALTNGSVVTANTTDFASVDAAKNSLSQAWNQPAGSLAMPHADDGVILINRNHIVSITFKMAP